jgi:hypothetical protein
MHRTLTLLSVTLLGLAGCLGAADENTGTDPTTMPGNGPAVAPFVPPSLVAEDGTVRLVEVYDGMVTAANLGVFVISPDQLGQVERAFYVHEGTRNLTLDLVAADELMMYVMDPACHDLDCAVVVETEGGAAVHAVEAPAVGGWEVVFFKRDPGAAEIDYALTLTKDQAYLHAVEEETYAGAVVAGHLGAIRISPDQLGDVYREFWVHEGVFNLTVDVAASDDFYFVLGQSDRGRDSTSEEGWVTEGGMLSLQFEEPHAGGWYMIFFHHPDGPGLAEIDYTVQVAKQR